MTELEIAKTNLANCKRHHAEKLKEWEDERDRMKKEQARTNIAYREIKTKICQLQDIISGDWE